MKICNKKDCNNEQFCKGLCRKCYAKQYYLNNKAKINKRNKKWGKKHRKFLAKWNKQYAKDYKRGIAKHTKQWQKENKQYQKQQYQKHKEKRAKWEKQYRKTLAGKAVKKASAHNRRLLTKDLNGKIIQRVYEANIKKYGILTCYLCFKPIIFSDKRLRDSLDHSIPLSRKGTNEYENLGIAHKICNLRKFTMTLEEWFNLYPELKKENKYGFTKRIY